LFSRENKPFPIKKFRPIFPAWGHKTMDCVRPRVFQANEWHPHKKLNKNGQYRHFRAIQV